jgi:hypothetical protein
MLTLYIYLYILFAEIFIHMYTVILLNLSIMRNLKSSQRRNILCLRN